MNRRNIIMGENKPSLCFSFPTLHQHLPKHRAFRSPGSPHPSPGHDLLFEVTSAHANNFMPSKHSFCNSSTSVWVCMGLFVLFLLRGGIHSNTFCRDVMSCAFKRSPQRPLISEECGEKTWTIKAKISPS